MAITNLPEWETLQSHFDEMRHRHMRELFQADPDRFARFSLTLGDVLFDYSKNRITETTLTSLLRLAEATQVPEAIDAMFRGDTINITENRPALHVALRNRGNRPIVVDGRDVMPDVNKMLAKMRAFSEDVRAGRRRGHTGKRFTDVVNIGIGGSHLGPLMVTHALTPFVDGRLRVHFVSNVDPTAIVDTLRRVDPETTLFLVASKSFTTQETMLNAQTARRWVIEQLGDEAAIARHFVAMSTNGAAVQRFGIDENNMFEFWDWVGGRFSLWSSIGLSIALYVGPDQFDELLAGAHIADEHFRTAPLKENIPVIMALLGLWYINFFDAASHAVLPYDESLRYFNEFLQQLDMESNGKRVTAAGERIAVNTAPIVWGRPGTDGQHTFYQLLHQGTRLVPCDFLAAAQSNNPNEDQHEVLLAHCFAQTKALMEGRSAAEARHLLLEAGLSPGDAETLAPAKTFPGNQPSNTFLYKRLNPRTLGLLCALYEHKIFVQGTMWGVNSFDQMGVELGKELADTLLPVIKSGTDLDGPDSSTNGLLSTYNRWRRPPTPSI